MIPFLGKKATLAMVLAVRVMVGVIRIPPFLWETKRGVIIKERRPLSTLFQFYWEIKQDYTEYGQISMELGTPF